LEARESHLHGHDVRENACTHAKLISFLASLMQRVNWSGCELQESGNIRISSSSPRPTNAGCRLPCERARPAFLKPRATAATTREDIRVPKRTIGHGTSELCPSRGCPWTTGPTAPHAKKHPITHWPGTIVHHLEWMGAHALKPCTLGSEAHLGPRLTSPSETRRRRGTRARLHTW